MVPHCVKEQTKLIQLCCFIANAVDDSERMLGMNKYSTTLQLSLSQKKTARMLKKSLGKVREFFFFFSLLLWASKWISFNWKARAASLSVLKHQYSLTGGSFLQCKKWEWNEIEMETQHKKNVCLRLCCIVVEIKEVTKRTAKTSWRKKWIHAKVQSLSFPLFLMEELSYCLKLFYHLQMIQKNKLSCEKTKVCKLTKLYENSRNILQQIGNEKNWDCPSKSYSHNNTFIAFNQAWWKNIKFDW